MAAGKINLKKASGGITAITGVDGTGNTELILPESGTVATTAGATETSTGLIELATTAEAQARTDDTRAITPLKLFNSLKGSNQSLASNGYQKLHGGLIIQWGTYSGVLAHTSSYTPIFPIAFPNACVKVACQYGNTAIDTALGVGFEKITQKLTNSFTFQWGWQSGGSAQVDVDYIAIGY